MGSICEGRIRGYIRMDSSKMLRSDGASGEGGEEGIIFFGGRVKFFWKRRYLIWVRGGGDCDKYRLKVLVGVICVGGGKGSSFKRFYVFKRVKFFVS